MAVLVFRWRTLDPFGQAFVDAAIKDDRTNEAESQGRKPVLVFRERTLDPFGQASVDAAIKDDRTNEAEGQGRKPVLVFHARGLNRFVILGETAVMDDRIKKRARAFVV